MKIKEAIIEGVNQRDRDNVGPFAFTYFVLSIVPVWANLAANLLDADFPAARINGIRSGGKRTPTNEIKWTDLIPVFTGNDMLRHNTLFRQSLSFLDWFFEQEVPENSDDDDEPIMWNSVEYIAKMWNQFVETHELD